MHKRARRGDAERIDNEGRELRWLEGGDVRLAPVQPAWSTGAAPANRLAILLVMLLLAAAALLCGDVGRPAAQRKARMRDRIRARLNFGDFVSNMTDNEFRRYYRIPRSRAEGNHAAGPQSFEELVAAVTPAPSVLHRQQQSARISSGSFIGYELRVSCALRYLAGGSYLDIMYLHGVGKAWFFRELWPTLQVWTLPPLNTTPTTTATPTTTPLRPTPTPHGPPTPHGRRSTMRCPSSHSSLTCTISSAAACSQRASRARRTATSSGPSAPSTASSSRWSDRP